MMKETLAQVAARLDEELDNMAGGVYTFSALLPRSIDYMHIREEIYNIVESHGLYIGDLSWSVYDATTAKILVGVGKSSSTYTSYYNTGAR